MVILELHRITTLPSIPTRCTCRMRWSSNSFSSVKLMKTALRRPISPLSKNQLRSRPKSNRMMLQRLEANPAPSQSKSLPTVLWQLRSRDVRFKVIPLRREGISYLITSITSWRSSRGGASLSLSSSA